MARQQALGQVRAGATRIGSTVGDGLARYRQLLGRRDAAVLLAAGAVSEIGDWFNAVALIALAYEFGDNSALGVGAMLALRLVPRLIFQAPAGALVDRWPGRGLLVIAHLVMAALAAAFVALVAFPELWLLFALVLALETANTVAWPAFRAQLARETPPEQFAAVNGLLSILLTAAQFVGPVLGGLVLVAFGPTPVFLVNGLTFLGVAIVAARVRGSGAAGAELSASPSLPVPPAPTPPLAAEVRGYGWLLRRTELTLFAAAALGVTVAVRGAISLFVVRADDLGLGEGGPGYFFAAVALGAVIGGLVAGTGSYATPAALGGAALAMIVCAAALVCFGAAGSPLPALVALAVAGLATNVYEILALTFFQHRLPATVYGRFMALFMLALGIGGIVGALAGPLVQTAVSVTAALAVISVPGIACALALLLRTARATPGTF